MPAKKSPVANFFHRLWEGIKSVARAIAWVLGVLYEFLIHLIKLLGGVVKYGVMAIVGLALAVFLIAMSFYFAAQAFGLSESAAWQQTRDTLIKAATTFVVIDVGAHAIKSELQKITK